MRAGVASDAAAVLIQLEAYLLGLLHDVRLNPGRARMLRQLGD
jgi:hypothetical protein